jgi:hypothetical protein
MNTPMQTPAAIPVLSNGAKKGSCSCNDKAAVVTDYPTQERPNQTETIVSTTRSTNSYPTEEPPTQGIGAVQAAAWQNNKKVIGMWTNCVDRNTYMYVEGLGWRKFLETSDSAMMAFNIIAAHAKTTNKAVSFYEGDDGKVTTLYVF